VKKHIDQLNRTILLKDIPKRIVSLVPSQTELLVDLGLEKYIVGITKFCVHPKDLKSKKTIVGGTKKIYIEKIKQLKPTIILCNKEENTKEIVEICSKICPVHISDIFSIEDNIGLIKMYGDLFDCEDRSIDITNFIQSKLNDFNLFISSKPTIKIAYFIWRNPWMIAANKTFINYLLSINKFENIYQDFERYPEIDLKKADLKKADYIFLSSEPYPFKNRHFSEIKAVTNKSNTILVDGEYFSWYGSRLKKAFDYFKTLRIKLEEQ
jgi:ABC-type Fe3+-hydroxamate transport system substrate-binding protein